MDRSHKYTIIAAGVVLAAVKLAMIPLSARLPTGQISSFTDALLAGLLAVSAWCAANRSRGFAKAVWRSVAVVAMLWAASFLIGIVAMRYDSLQQKLPVFWKSTIIGYLIFLAMLVPLLLREDQEDLGLDWRRTLDIVQLAIVSFAVFLVFYYIPQNAEASEARRLQDFVLVHWVRDGFFALAFLYRGWRSRIPALRNLQLGLGGFFFLFLLNTTFGSEALWVWHWPLLVVDAVGDIPVLCLLAGAVLWSSPAAPAAPRQRGSKKSVVWAQLLPVLLPIAVVVMASRATQQNLRIAWAAVAASFLCYALRLVLTQRRQETVSAALSESEAKYQQLVERMAEIVFALAPDGTVTYISPAIEQVLGYKPAEVLGQSIFNFLHGEDVPAGEERMAALRAGTAGSREWRFLTKSGQVKWLRASSRPVIKDGRVVEITGVSMDITESKSLQERFWKAFLASPTPMTISRLEDGRYVEVNEHWLKLGKYERDEVIGHTSTEIKIWSVEERAKFAAALRETGSVRNLEVNFHFGRGKPFTGLLSAEVVELDGEQCVLASILDITELRSVEEQLRRAQKIEAIGNLSASIAHDFNNLLTVIVGFAARLRDKVGDDENLHQIEEATERGIGLTRQLLAFSRRQVLQPHVVGLNTVVQRMEQMLRPLLGSRVRLSTACASDLWEVKADAAQLEQVIMNLAINARDAMPNGGALMFETQNTVLDDEFTRRNPGARAGEFTMLAVQDSGAGMDAGTMQRIFEPFFTTKEAGKGTGLGLSTVYGIVKQSGGYIKVESEVGRGTTFRIYLPRAARTGSAAGEMAQAARG